MLSLEKLIALANLLNLGSSQIKIYQMAPFSSKKNYFSQRTTIWSECANSAVFRWMVQKRSVVKIRIALIYGADQNVTRPLKHFIMVLCVASWILHQISF